MSGLEPRVSFVWCCTGNPWRVSETVEALAIVCTIVFVCVCVLIRGFSLGRIPLFSSFSLRGFQTLEKSKNHMGAQSVIIACSVCSPPVSMVSLILAVAFLL